MSLGYSMSKLERVSWYFGLTYIRYMLQGSSVHYGSLGASSSTFMVPGAYSEYMVGDLIGGPACLPLAPVSPVQVPGMVQVWYQVLVPECCLLTYQLHRHNKLKMKRKYINVGPFIWDDRRCQYRQKAWGDANVKTVPQLLDLISDPNQNRFDEQGYRKVIRSYPAFPGSRKHDIENEPMIQLLMSMYSETIAVRIFEHAYGPVGRISWGDYIQGRGYCETAAIAGEGRKHIVS